MICKKKKYKDKISAMFALAKCKNNKKGKRQETRIYYCEECNCWHLTKIKKYDNRQY